MKVDEYIDFQRLLGKKVVSLNGIPFGEYRSRFYWSLPRHVSYDVDNIPMIDMLNVNILGLIAMSRGITSHKASFCVFNKRDYAIEILHKKKRNQTRRGLKECEIHEASWNEMIRFGLDINREALVRQNRASVGLGDPLWWERQCRVSSQFPDVRVWGAYVNGDITSYVHAVLHDDCDELGKMTRTGNIIHFMSANAHLKKYPNEALIFTVTQELINKYRCDRIILGSGSDDNNLLTWKRHMGYSVEIKNYRIAVNPLLHLAKYFVPKLRIWMDGSGLV